MQALCYRSYIQYFSRLSVNQVVCNSIICNYLTDISLIGTILSLPAIIWIYVYKIMIRDGHCTHIV